MKIGVLTSGGDAPGMNVAIRAVVRAAINTNNEVYGIRDGYLGLVEGNIFEMKRNSVSGIIKEGGTILGTSRLPEFVKKETRKKGIEQLKKFGIETLICIGGDGTYRGAMELGKMGIKVIGLPGTIDNDIAGTDYTIGFHTALQTIIECIDKLRDTSSSHKRCSIVEVMGRRCGDLAINAGICDGAEFIVTPENPVTKEEMISKLTEFVGEGRRHAIIIVTEKMYDVHLLAKELSEKSGFSTKATILGYIQRGGSPSSEDRLLGSRMGEYAIELINKGIYNVCVGIRDNRMVYQQFANVVDQVRPKSELFQLINKLS
jgi:6-phosphofructokinase 1